MYSDDNTLIRPWQICNRNVSCFDFLQQAKKIATGQVLFWIYKISWYLSQQGNIKILYVYSDGVGLLNTGCTEDASDTTAI